MASTRVGIKSPSVSSGQAGASEALAQPERLASPVSLLSPGPSACKRGRSKGSKNSLQLSSPARFKPSPSLGRARIVVPLNKETPQPEQGPQARLPPLELHAVAGIQDCRHKSISTYLILPRLASCMMVETAFNKVNLQHICCCSLPHTRRIVLILLFRVSVRVIS